jgi:hypothetical protein
VNARLWRLGIPLLLSSVACGEEATRPTPDPYPCGLWCQQITLPLDSLTSLDIQTYDGSGQTVHPDVAYLPEGFGPDAQVVWLGVTPYPGGNAGFENPSIYASMNALHMIVPRGLRNPLVIPDTVDAGPEIDPPPDFPDEAGELETFHLEAAAGHFSDADLVTADRLYVIYRLSRNSDFLFRSGSDDGGTWSDAEIMLRGPFASLLSPAVVVREGWEMWHVDARNGGCRASSTAVSYRSSADGLNWSAPEAVAMPIDGYVVWHLDVQWIPEDEEYWTLIAAYPEGTTCGATDVFFARSPDGRTWEVTPQPVLVKGTSPFMRDAVYRSTFRHDHADRSLTIWYSGHTANVWRTVVQRRLVADVVGQARP